MPMSFIILGIVVVAILVVIAGLGLLIASKEYRIVGIVLLIFGCLLGLGTVGVFFLMVSRMG